MSTPLPLSPSPVIAEPEGPSAQALDRLVQIELAPRVRAIDEQGEYPESVLRALGALGGFAGVAGSTWGGRWSEGGNGLAETIDIMARVGEACLSTAFAVWCQTACARYLQLSGNAAAKDRWLPGLATGRQLGGTGLSNTFKSNCRIERFLLEAERVPSGYRVNGTLPWVSNLGHDHIFVTGCPLAGDGRLVFFVVDCSQPGFELARSAHFTALEGTATYACHFRDVLIPDTAVLAGPEESAGYLARIQPGMILAQVGMGFGLVRDCIRLIERMQRTHAHVNLHETEQAAALAEELACAQQQARQLALDADRLPTGAAQAELLTAVMEVRLAAGELSLRAAQAAMLHQGARGYVRGAAAQRRLRESYFVAIVTPSLKHLRHELARRRAIPS